MHRSSQFTEADLTGTMVNTALLGCYSRWLVRGAEIKVLSVLNVVRIGNVCSRIRKNCSPSSCVNFARFHNEGAATLY